MQISRWIEVLSELFVNLAAGWLGAVVILPILGLPDKIDFKFLLFDILMAILSLLIAVWLRRGIYED